MLISMNYSGTLRFRMAFAAVLMLLFTSDSLFAQGYDTTMWRFRDPKQFGFTVENVVAQVEAVLR